MSTKPAPTSPAACSGHLHRLASPPVSPTIGPATPVAAHQHVHGQARQEAQPKHHRGLQVHGKGHHGVHEPRAPSRRPRHVVASSSSRSASRTPRHRRCRRRHSSSSRPSGRSGGPGGAVHRPRRVRRHVRRPQCLTLRDHEAARHGRAVHHGQHGPGHERDEVAQIGPEGTCSSQLSNLVNRCWEDWLRTTTRRPTLAVNYARTSARHVEWMMLGVRRLQLRRPLQVQSTPTPHLPTQLLMKGQWWSRSTTQALHTRQWWAEGVLGPRQCQQYLRAGGVAGQQVVVRARWHPAHGSALHAVAQHLRADGRPCQQQWAAIRQR